MRDKKVDFTTKTNILTRPFELKDLEWRIGRSSVANGWATLLTYVTARAIQRRLDEVFGAMGWTDEYRQENGGIICRLCVLDPNSGEWICKENGSPETQMEAFKGGISGALKRVAASGFGIGRYLYDLDETYADFSQNRNDDEGYSNWARIGSKNEQKVNVYYRTPNMPKWALPASEEHITALRAAIETKQETEGAKKICLLTGFNSLEEIVKHRAKVSELDYLTMYRLNEALKFIEGVPND